MISNFDSFLNEKNFLVVTGMQAINYRISVIPGKGTWTVMPTSSKDLDKETKSNKPKSVIGKDIEETINDQLKKFRQDIRVKQDLGYQGAGYSYTVDFDYLLKRLNKS